MNICLAISRMGGSDQFKSRQRFDAPGETRCQGVSARGMRSSAAHGRGARTARRGRIVPDVDARRRGLDEHVAPDALGERFVALAR